MVDIQFEKLIKSMENMDVKDKSYDCEQLMRQMLNANKMYGILLKEVGDMLYDYITVYGDLYFFEIEISEIVYDIEFTNDDTELFYSINGFIKFMNKNVPVDFRLSDVIKCIEKYDQ